MHVSMLAGLLPTSSAYSEHKARVATPFHQLFGGGVVERCSNAPPNAPTAPQREKRSKSDLQPALQAGSTECRLTQHDDTSEPGGDGSRLRAIYDQIFGFS